MVLENIRLSSNRATVTAHDGLMIQTWISVINRLYTLSAVYMFHFSKKITCFALYLVLWTELIQYMSLHQSQKEMVRLICNYYNIQCVCNRSITLVVIF
jgi:hypothetical protein